MAKVFEILNHVKAISKSSFYQSLANIAYNNWMDWSFLELLIEI